MNTRIKIAALAAPLLAMTVMGAMPVQAQSYQSYDGPIYQDYPSSYSTQSVQTYGQSYGQSYEPGGYSQGYDQGGYYDQGYDRPDYDRGYQGQPQSRPSNNNAWVGLAVGAVAGALVVSALNDNRHDRGHYYRDRGHRGRDHDRRGYGGRRW